MFRSVWMTLTTCCVLLWLLAACQPVAPRDDSIGDPTPDALDAPIVENEPVQEWDRETLGDPDGVSLCADIPNQRIAVAQRSVFCELIDAHPSECNLEDVAEGRFGLTLVDSHSTNIPIVPGADPAEGNPIDVLLLEGENFGPLYEQLHERSDALVNRNYTVHLVKASGYSPGHSPFGLGPTVAGSTGMDDLTDQWAHTYVMGTNYFGNLAHGTGENVVVGVFDTSPYEVGHDGIPAMIDVLSPPFMLTPYSVPIDPLSTSIPTNSLPNATHGVFVSSLVHSMAPDAEIHLYQVLDGQGNGTMYSIDKQLERFYQYINQNLESRYLLNMSFGATCPDHLIGEDGAEREQFDKDVSLFATWLELFYWRRVAMVAAAGNTGRPNAQPEPQFPASYLRVMSVSALNADGGTACFSHRGEFYLPGGDGILSADGTECLPNHAQCEDMTECEWAIKGVSTSSSTGLAYWSGTSFATPLLTGLLARRIADDVNVSLEDLRKELTTGDSALPLPITTPVPVP